MSYLLSFQLLSFVRNVMTEMWNCCSMSVCMNWAQGVCVTPYVTCLSLIGPKCRHHNSYMTYILYNCNTILITRADLLYNKCDVSLYFKAWPTLKDSYFSSAIPTKSNSGTLVSLKTISLIHKARVYKSTCQICVPTFSRTDHNIP